MNKNILIFSILFATSVVSHAQPVETDDAVVKIEKQRLVKFPDEVDQLQDSVSNISKKSTTKLNEAQRILQEIEKINHALGYIKKQPEQSRHTSILDSSQYLYPKPLMQPFHQQNHQTSGMNGETILIPSIRSVALDQQYISPHIDLQSVQYNIPPIKQQTKTKNKTKNNVLIFRPNKVVLPAPQDSSEQQQLPTHFVIPVRLYKHNKAEYIEKNAPQEYRVKGYKIVGDIDNFYGKANQKGHEVNNTNIKLKPKYHLFFLPRELALNEASKHNISEGTETKFEGKEEPDNNGSREEKVIGIQRPYKIQTSATSSSIDGGSSSNVTTQIIRKRVVPRPIREKEPTGSDLTDQQLSQDENSAVDPNTNTNINSKLNKPIINNNPTPIKTMTLRPNIPNLASFINRPNDSKNTTAGNFIRNRFQNIFKFPFGQGNKPIVASDIANQMQQMLPFRPTQTYKPTQPLYEINDSEVPQKIKDYYWDDEQSNSASDIDEADTSTEPIEKQIFGNRNTQMEAIKRGGIIIQRLKVRKGGIAIAGPGGVATAGSGGTAIVGPGGYALTHPRSLTIAGPGAKVFAIPSNVDLKDALERTNINGQSIPREGKLVAIGPTVYYSPATGSDADLEVTYP